MSAAAPVAGVAAAETLKPIFEVANTELIGFHRTTTYVREDGKIVSDTFNISVRAWEAIAAVLGAAALEVALAFSPEQIAKDILNALSQPKSTTVLQPLPPALGFLHDLSFAGKAPVL